MNNINRQTLFQISQGHFSGLRRGFIFSETIKKNFVNENWKGKACSKIVPLKN